jgi:uncharacterized protein YegL
MYSELLSKANPGLILILLDQSTSMVDPYNNSTKAEFAALAVNKVIEELISACTSGDEVRDRCWVSVIGYGQSVNTFFVDKISDLAKNPNTETRKKKVSDGSGGLVEVDEIMRVFVTPVANGGTPMAEAFQQAIHGVSEFISTHPDSFPPVVINITDGEPNDFDSAIVKAQKLTQLQTSDGNVILLNAHISSASAGKIELPNNDVAFKSNKFASFLFKVSSVLPDALASKAPDLGFNVQPGAKGFVFNADAETLIKLLNFGSLGAILR